MKLLLDENLPHQLRSELPGHDCATVAYMGWGGVENGELLMRAAAAGFAALLTMDSGMQYEQNLTNLPVAVVIIETASNDIDDIRPILPRLLDELQKLSPKQVTRIS
jgi:predicted nuclease of predicted toxin-antitoxin system